MFHFPLIETEIKSLVTNLLLFPLKLCSSRPIDFLSVRQTTSSSISIWRVFIKKDNLFNQQSAGFSQIFCPAWISVLCSHHPSFTCIFDFLFLCWHENFTLYFPNHLFLNNKVKAFFISSALVVFKIFHSLLSYKDYSAEDKSLYNWRICDVEDSLPISRSEIEKGFTGRKPMGTRGTVWR